MDKLIKNNFKKTLITILLVLIFGFLFIAPKSSLAQSNNDSYQPQTQNEYLTPETNPDVPKNLSTFTQSAMIEVMKSMICQLAGSFPSDPNMQCLGIDPNTGRIGTTNNNQGALGVVMKFVTVLYTPPAHFSDFTHDLAQNFGFPKKTFAQTTGIDSLSPLAEIWKIFRNFVYVMFVILFVIIGIAIMLRVKIDPRTVMTIQNQIPKLIIGLILVTFSFAIAGLLIDLMWLAIYIVINTLTLAYVDPATPAEAANQITKSLNQNPIGFAGNDFVFDSLGSLVANISGLAYSAVYNLISGAGIPTSNPGPIDWLINLPGAIFSALVGALVGIFAQIVVFIIILIAILWALFRLWFVLIQAYISILINIALAPIWIMLGLFPGAGQKVGFSSWIRDLVANLAAFPAAIAMMLMGAIFMKEFSQAGAGGGFLPPLIANPSHGQSLGALIALGFLLATPNVVKMTKDVFKASGINYGTVGQGIGVGRGIAGGFMGSIWGRMYYRDPRTGLTGGAAADMFRSTQRRLTNPNTTPRPLQIAKDNFITRTGPAKTVSNVARGIINFRNQGRNNPTGSTSGNPTGSTSGNEPFQGPVPNQGPNNENETRFRETGETS